EAETSIERRGETIVASGGGHVLAFRCWDAGAPAFANGSIDGELETSRGSDALLVCTLVESQPIPLPPRAEIEVRFERTADAWQRWVDFHHYEGPWQEPVERSALALKLLIYAPT